ncbi:uncharacterized protein LOC134346750 isoform X2 [Mobula hypostoma]|uniref:uncharacterized protein LOC134346750 isoform X2 n=1 Tax=Mobula hypostoma TaxID=723540 RepID=UPI002FC33510
MMYSPNMHMIEVQPEIAHINTLRPDPGLRNTILRCFANLSTIKVSRWQTGEFSSPLRREKRGKQRPLDPHSSGKMEARLDAAASPGPTKGALVFFTSSTQCLRYCRSTPSASCSLPGELDLVWTMLLPATERLWSQHARAMCRLTMFQG